MSAPRYRISLKLRALLRDRGKSVVKLADEAKLPVRLVQYALAGHPSATREDRRRIAPCLTMAEHVALGWTWNGDLVGELFSVEHSAPCSTPLSPAPLATTATKT